MIKIFITLLIDILNYLNKLVQALGKNLKIKLNIFFISQKIKVNFRQIELILIYLKIKNNFRLEFRTIKSNN